MLALFVGLEDGALEHLLQVGDHVAGIPAEDLVAPLAAEEYLDLPCATAGHNELGKEARAGYRLVHVIDEARQVDP